MLSLSVFGYSIYQISKDEFTCESLLLLGIVVLALMYAVKIQDRIILTEEQLRYYILATRHLDPNLTLEQLIALRFAPDEEFIGLVDCTLAENLTPSETKLAISEWRADNHRV